MILPKKYFLYLFFVFIFFNCSPPPVQENIVPQWILSQPKDPQNWYGIGVSKKLDENSREISRQRAVTEISEQIKISIKSELINSIESNNFNIDEFIKRNTTSRVNINKSNIEYRDSFLDEDHQYILAVLNKEKYFEEIKHKASDANNIAKNVLYETSENFSIKAVSNLNFAFKSIESYLDLDLKIEYPKGSDKYFSTSSLIVKKLRQLNSQIDIEFKPEILQIIPLINDNKRIQIRVVDKNNNFGVQGAKIRISFLDSLIDDILITRDDGVAVYQMESLSSRAGSRYLSFSLDYKSILDYVTITYAKLKSKEFAVNVIIGSPKVYYNGSIKNLGVDTYQSSIKESLKECFENNYSAIFVNNIKDADIVLDLSVNILEHADRVSDIYPFFVHAEGIISIKNNYTGEEILSSVIAEQKGADFNSIERAGINALKKLGKQLNTNMCE